MKFKFWVLQVKMFKFVEVENLGYPWTNWFVSQNLQIFGEGTILMKCSILHGCLNGCIQFLIFKIFNFFYMVFRWFEVGCMIWADEPNWCEPNQSTYRQHLPKVCLQHFHGQDEDWFRIFRTLLVHFWLGTMCEEGICQIWIFGFLRSKRSNLEVQKKWGVDV